MEFFDFISELDKKNKIILGTGISVTSITLLASAVSAFFPNKAPDPQKLDSRTKVVYMASKEFASLPEEEKINYIKKTGRSRRSAYRQLSRPEREAVAKNTTVITRKIRMKQMKERANKFFKMSTEEQNKYLDEMNARRDRWIKAREARNANRTRAANNSNNRGSRSTASNNNNRNSSNRSARRNARRQGFLEGMDSTTRAQWMEIRRRARERRQQQNK